MPDAMSPGVARPLRRALAALLVLASLAGAAAAADRPRVGLVLGGGGARGAAHIGVLEVLERLRVPVDCVAGTSMGALVAGAWAAGLDAAAMRRALAQADWNDMFRDDPDYTEIDFRQRRLQQRFLPGSEMGVTAQGVTVPGGLVSGQKIKLFFNQLVRADLGERLIERLPLPVSIVATDIGTGERVVFRDGSLTTAMRASMSVPGLMAPVEFEQRRLVDGGLVDNVPIREVRERCGADVVIAVNVGSPLLKPESVGSLLSVSAQMVAILTEQNVSQSLATLTSSDIYIRPDLDGITAADFERHAETADRGRAAAEQLAGQLARLAVSAQAYAAWWGRIAVREVAPPRVDAIEIAADEPVNPEVIARHLAQRPGEVLDTARLNRDLLRAYGDGHFSGVDYALLGHHGRQILRITPIAKPWGPDYLRFALNLDSNLKLGSSYTLRAAYQKTWLNPLGGELMATAEIGSNQALAVDWYQPLDVAQHWFVQAGAEVRRERADLFERDQRIAEYRVVRQTAELALGRNLGSVGELKLGWRERRRSADLEVGIPFAPRTGETLLTSGSVTAGGWFAAVDLDQLNRLYFPTRGWALRAGVFDSPRRDYGRYDVELRLVGQWGDTVVGARAAHTGATRERLPIWDAAMLGGFLHLSGFASGQLLGEGASYAHLRAERIVGRLPLGLRGDLRIGLALEAGRVTAPFTERQRTGWLDSTTLYLGGESPFGPVYLGLGHSTSGATNAYLFIGTP